MSGYTAPSTIFHPAINNSTNSTRYRFDLNQNCSGCIYEKPKIIKIEKMTFPIDILNKYAGEELGHICRQCSSCHNCR